MRNETWLILGVASVGAVLGIMVGASATPVVSVAAPTLFALAAATIGLVQTSQINKEVTETIKELGAQTQSSPELTTLRTQLATAPRRLGLILFAFSFAYLISIVVGAKARTNDWLVTNPTPPSLPWKSSGLLPPDIHTAFEWIAIQHKLKSLGYDDETIIALYAIQASEWARSRTSNSEAPASPRTYGFSKADVAPPVPAGASESPTSPSSSSIKTIEMDKEEFTWSVNEKINIQIPLSIKPAPSNKLSLPDILKDIEENKNNLPALANNRKPQKEAGGIL